MFTWWSLGCFPSFHKPADLPMGTGRAHLVVLSGGTLSNEVFFPFSLRELYATIILIPLVQSCLDVLLQHSLHVCCFQKLPGCVFSNSNCLDLFFFCTKLLGWESPVLLPHVFCRCAVLESRSSWFEMPRWEWSLRPSRCQEFHGVLVFFHQTFE